MSLQVTRSHEIVELTEKYDSEYEMSRNDGMPLKKYTIEDDINKLFEAIDIRNSHHGGGTASKSTMKRPMRQIGPSQVSGIGISEPVSLKQALRGLCISHASELAAVKKRVSRLSASPGVTEAGAVKRLYRAIVIEDAGKGSLLEVSLVPEKSPLTISDKVGEIVPISDEGSIALSGGHKERVDKLQFKSLSKNPIEPKRKTLDISKQSLRSQSLLKKKIVSKSHGQQNKGVNALDPTKNKHDLVPLNFSKRKSATKEADESSQSVERNGEISRSSKSSFGEYSSTSRSEESSLGGSHRGGCRPHMSKDLRWGEIHRVQEQHGSVSMRHFKLLRKLGGGDIGTVYLSELIGTNCFFAVKVMDNDFLIRTKKMLRAQTEKEILEVLDHPFLPTLYTCFTTNKFTCLVTEYCPCGNLHVLRQKQLTKSFPERAARFYVAEVLLALEYLHMLGVVYRDLKPKNILIREDGHIMLSDFDLSLKCLTKHPMVLDSSSPVSKPPENMSSSCSDSSCIDPFCLHPSWELSCFTPARFLSSASRTRKLESELAAQVNPLPRIVVEPTNARSNSFVGTYEYLAPEIIRGEGHGCAVDWWTFGMLLYELLYGRMPFKGSTNEDTVSNIRSQSLKFPHSPMVSSQARDLIRRLLKKEPENRLGSSKGAAEIKQHPFFEGMNWALIRCETPPEVPKLFDLGNVLPEAASDHDKTGKCLGEFECRRDETLFEMF